MYYYIFMREFQERRLLRKIIFSRFILIFLVSTLIFFAYASIKVYLRSRKAAEINELVRREMTDLENKKTAMEALINRLETETGAEEEIRSKFPVKKPGENMVVIVDEEVKIGDNSGESDSSGVLSKIWQFVKNIF